ncbi:MAG: amidohydrolase family protein [Candidatus Hadarchaeales archaeon]
MPEILIKNGYILTMDGEGRVYQRGSIAIDEGRITAIGDVKGPADTVIDASGKVILPGLVNAHTHLPMTLLRGVADDMTLKPWLTEKIWPLERHLTPERVYIGGLLGCLEMIKSGTTCFADQYFYMEEVARAVEESGIRGVLSYGIIELGDSTRRKTEINAGERLVKNCHGKAGGRVLTMFGPHAPYTCSKECLLEVKELAKKYEVGIHIHVSESDEDINDTIAFQGERPIRFLEKIGFFGPEVLAAHCVKVLPDEMEILAKNGVKVAHNPVSNMKLASGIAPVTEFLKKNIVVGIGTDGCASNNNLDMFEEMKICALVHKIRESNPTVAPAPEVLKMATVGGAKALRLEGDIGSIDVGKKADIILINLKKPHLTPAHNIISDLVYSAHGDDVDTVIVDGRIIMKERKVLTLDEEEVLQKAQKAAEEMVSEHEGEK